MINQIAAPQYNRGPGTETCADRSTYPELCRAIYPRITVIRLVGRCHIPQNSARLRLTAQIPVPSSKVSFKKFSGHEDMAVPSSRDRVVPQRHWIRHKWHIVAFSANTDKHNAGSGVPRAIFAGESIPLTLKLLCLNHRVNTNVLY